MYNTCTVRLIPSVGIRTVNKVDILSKMWCMSCVSVSMYVSVLLTVGVVIPCHYIIG